MLVRAFFCRHPANRKRAGGRTRSALLLLCFVLQADSGKEVLLLCSVCASLHNVRHAVIRILLAGFAVGDLILMSLHALRLQGPSG